MKVLQILAVGLASAFSASAALCKPSPPAPSASSVSSVASSSPSPSTPATPQPICIRNVVTNSYFDAGSLDGWTLTQFNGGTVTGASGTCGQFSTCVLLDTVTGGYVGLSQTVSNTGVGLIYTFTFNYRAIATLSSDAILVCQINGGAGGLSWSWTADSIPVSGWGYFMTAFAAPTTSLTVNCALSGSYENKVQLDYFNLNC
ncbi:hypothetical protein Sste5346_008514 [Sporothrix stenoceras]|uniref:Uncharacterized protein n=1 Tax=Sporothrix stenoceras TaxID=5173 RepID=A0ABR3YQC3_9PEZI